MILNQKIKLESSKTDRILQVMKMASWYDGRRTEISNAEQYYMDRNIELFQAVKDFFAEFSGIAGKWYIEVENTIT